MAFSRCFGSWDSPATYFLAKVPFPQPLGMRQQALLNCFTTQATDLSVTNSVSYHSIKFAVCSRSPRLPWIENCFATSSQCLMGQVSQQSAVALGQSVTDTSVSAIQLILFLACFITLSLTMLTIFPPFQAGEIAKPSFQLQKQFSYGYSTD